MTAQPNHEDGELAPALAALADAITALCEPLPRLIDDKLVTIPSRYMQLRDATMGEQSNTGGGGGSKSRPPFWLDSFDLCREIDETIACWQPAYTGLPPTIGRIHTLQQRNWRPQDTRQLEQITSALTAWATAIDTLLDPPRRWSLPSPCPACGTAIVYRRDTSGEQIRQPALQIGVNGCHCTRCHATWGPQLFTHLARVLGYDLPAGLLE